MSKLLRDIQAKQGLSLPDTGQYMSGNVFSKVIDLVSTANYAAAGATDALLSGENPLEGAGSGIKNRESFINVAENHGVPKPLAVPLGLIGDIAIPTLPGAALVSDAFKAGKASSLAGRLARDSATDIERIVAESRAANPRSGTRAADALGVAAAHGRNTAAAEQYIKVLEATGNEDVATAAARKAAFAAKTDPNALKAGLAAVGKTTTTLDDVHGSTVGRLMKGWQYVNDNVFRQMSDVLENNPIFGNVGPIFAKRGKLQLDISQRLYSTMLEEIRPILSSIKKEEYQAFYEMGHGLRPLEGALGEKMKKIWDLRSRIFKGLSSRGVHQEFDIASAMIKGMSPDALQRVQHWIDATSQYMARSAADGSLIDFEFMRSVLKGGREARIGYAIARRNGRIAEGGKVLMPLQERVNSIPIYMKAKALAEKGRPSTLNDIKAAIKHFDPTMPPNEVEGVAIRIQEERALAPNDIRKSFQHQRANNSIPIDPDLVEMDPNKWGTKMVFDAAERIAQAEAWGGADEVYGVLSEKLRRIHGLEPGHKAPTEGQAAFDTMDQAFKALTRQDKNPMGEAMRVMNHITNTMFLGPRTIIVQALNIPNSGALSGISNSFAGILEFNRNPALRAIADRIGATFPGAVHALDDNLLTATLSKNPIMHAIGWADRQARGGAAVAGGLHALEIEERLVKGLASRDKGAVDRAISELMDYGIDPREIVKRGGKLDAGDLENVMMQAANITNFRGDPLATSRIFSTPSGKFFTKFRQFSFQQGHFINRLWKRAMAGDRAPLLRYAAAFPAIYFPVFRALNALKSKPVDTENDKEMLKNLLFIGALGFWGDAAMALGSDSEALSLGFVAGANTSSLIKVAGAAKDLASSPFNHERFGEALNTLTPATIKQGRALWADK